VVSGWFKGEFTALGEPWLDHDERYRRSEDFIRVLRGIWTEAPFTFAGDFYRIRDFDLKPKPIQKPHPEIFQGGNSPAARATAARVSDWYFMNASAIDGVRVQIEEVSSAASQLGRRPKVALNAFVVARDTEREAHEVIEEIISMADQDAVQGYKDAVKHAGKATANKTGMWAQSELRDLVQDNDGFKTGLIGTPEQIAERVISLKAAGVNLLLTGFLHFQEEIEYFGQRVMPLIRQLESAH
jgi:FMNH2-dependent dimethyl sulfone monooxygenase